MKQVFENVFHYEEIARSNIRAITLNAVFANKLKEIISVLE